MAIYLDESRVLNGYQQKPARLPRVSGLLLENAIPAKVFLEFQGATVLIGMHWHSVGRVNSHSRLCFSVSGQA